MPLFFAIKSETPLIWATELTDGPAFCPMEMFSVVRADGHLAAGMVLGPLVEAAAVVTWADWVLVVTLPLLEAVFAIFEAMLLLQGIMGGLLLATFGGPLALLLVMMGV